MRKKTIRLKEIAMPSYAFVNHFKTFDCGVKKINDFLVGEAETIQKEGVAATTLFVNEEEEEIAAFYTVHISINYIKDKVLNQPVPVTSIHIAYFAVDSKYQNKTLGRQLMRSLMTNLLFISETVGFSAITVESLPHSYDFYINCGFEDVDPQKSEMNNLATYDLMIPYRRIFSEL